LSALALSRLAALLHEENSEIFIQNLVDFKDFELVVEHIGSVEDISDSILKYFFNFLENVTSFKNTRDQLNCIKIFELSI